MPKKRGRKNRPKTPQASSSKVMSFALPDPEAVEYSASAHDEKFVRQKQQTQTAAVHNNDNNNEEDDDIDIEQEEPSPSHSDAKQGDDEPSSSPSSRAYKIAHDSRGSRGSEESMLEPPTTTTAAAAAPVKKQRPVVSASARNVNDTVHVHSDNETPKKSTIHRTSTQSSDSWTDSNALVKSLVDNPMAWFRKYDIESNGSLSLKQFEKMVADVYPFPNDEDEDEKGTQQHAATLQAIHSAFYDIVQAPRDSFVYKDGAYDLSDQLEAYSALPEQTEFLELLRDIFGPTSPRADSSSAASSAAAADLYGLRKIQRLKQEALSVEKNKDPKQMAWLRGTVKELFTWIERYGEDAVRERGALQSEHETLKNAFAEKVDTIERLSKEQSIQQEQYESEQQTSNEYKQNMDAIYSRQHETRDNNVAFQKRHQADKVEMHEVEAKLKRAQQHNEQLQRDLAKYSDECQRLQETCTSLNRQKEMFEKKYESEVDKLKHAREMMPYHHAATTHGHALSTDNDTGSDDDEDGRADRESYSEEESWLPHRRSDSDTLRIPCTLQSRPASTRFGDGLSMYAQSESELAPPVLLHDHLLHNAQYSSYDREESRTALSTTATGVFAHRDSQPLVAHVVALTERIARLHDQVQSSLQSNQSNTQIAAKHSENTNLVLDRLKTTQSEYNEFQAQHRRVVDALNADNAQRDQQWQTRVHCLESRIVEFEQREATIGTRLGFDFVAMAQQSKHGLDSISSQLQHAQQQHAQEMQSSRDAVQQALATLSAKETQDEQFSAMQRMFGSLEDKMTRKLDENNRQTQQLQQSMESESEGNQSMVKMEIEKLTKVVAAKQEQLEKCLQANGAQHVEAFGKVMNAVNSSTDAMQQSMAAKAQSESVMMNARNAALKKDVLDSMQAMDARLSQQHMFDREHLLQQTHGNAEQGQEHEEDDENKNQHHWLSILQPQIDEIRTRLKSRDDEQSAALASIQNSQLCLQQQQLTLKQQQTECVESVGKKYTADMQRVFGSLEDKMTRKLDENSCQMQQLQSMREQSMVSQNESNQSKMKLEIEKLTKVVAAKQESNDAKFEQFEQCLQANGAQHVEAFGKVMNAVNSSTDTMQQSMAAKAQSDSVMNARFAELRQNMASVSTIAALKKDVLDSMQAMDARLSQQHMFDREHLLQQTQNTPNANEEPEQEHEEDDENENKNHLGWLSILQPQIDEIRTRLKNSEESQSSALASIQNSQAEFRSCLQQQQLTLKQQQTECVESVVKKHATDMLQTMQAIGDRVQSQYLQQQQQQHARDKDSLLLQQIKKTLQDKASVDETKFGALQQSLNSKMDALHAYLQHQTKLGDDKFETLGKLFNVKAKTEVDINEQTQSMMNNAVSKATEATMQRFATLQDAVHGLKQQMFDCLEQMDALRLQVPALIVDAVQSSHLQHSLVSQQQQQPSSANCEDRQSVDAAVEVQEAEDEQDDDDANLVLLKQEMEQEMQQMFAAQIMDAVSQSKLEMMQFMQAMQTQTRQQQLLDKSTKECEPADSDGDDDEEQEDVENNNHLGWLSILQPQIDEIRTRLKNSEESQSSALASIQRELKEHQQQTVHAIENMLTQTRSNFETQQIESAESVQKQNANALAEIRSMCAGIEQRVESQDLNDMKASLTTALQNLRTQVLNDIKQLDANTETRLQNLESSLQSNRLSLILTAVEQLAQSTKERLDALNMESMPHAAKQYIQEVDSNHQRVLREMWTRLSHEVQQQYRQYERQQKETHGMIERHLHSQQQQQQQKLCNDDDVKDPELVYVIERIDGLQHMLLTQTPSTCKQVTCSSMGSCATVLLFFGFVALCYFQCIGMIANGTLRR